MDSSALLSQQLNNRWLKKASIQSGSALENHTEESPQAADKTHRHTKRTHMQITWIVRVAHAANGRTVNIFFSSLAANSYFIAHRAACKTHSDETVEGTRAEKRTHGRCCLIPGMIQ